MFNNPFDKINEIYKRSGLSISFFAKVIGKDRRTVTAWLGRTITKEPSFEVKQSISKFFRYPYKIWDENCVDNDFIDIITGMPQEEVSIIDEGYIGGLRYILEFEDLERFVIHPQFPGPMYRDRVVPRVYRTKDSYDITELKRIRTQKMLEYSFASIEWYTIKALLSFAFSPIGNFYTKKQKLKILELLHKNFNDNYNKRLYFYDSYERKIYGMEIAYTSINIKKSVMFFKTPLDSVFIEIRNKKLVEKIHKFYTNAAQAPSHVNPDKSTEILRILQKVLEQNETIEEFYENINEQTDYAQLFLNNISLDLHGKLSRPKSGQKIN